MQNVKDILIRCLAFTFFVILLLVTVNIAKSCDIEQPNTTQNTGTRIEISDTKKIEILLDKVEELEKKDSTYQEAIKQIDSLCNELDVVHQSIDEQYSYLSDRYNNDKQSKKR